MDEKLTILIDIDNVCNDLCNAVLSVYNEDYNDNLTVNDVTNYYIENFVKPEAKENFHNYFIDKRTWKRIKGINIEAVQWLIDNHNVYFVTATEPANLPKKQNWLSRQFKNIDLRKRLVRCYDKGMMLGDVMIDDCTDNLWRFNGVAVCIDYPWNQSWDGIRVKDVNEFIEKILKGR